MELLTLPEPAATLWRRASPALERTGMGEFLNRNTAGGRRRVTQQAAAARARGGTETTILDWQGPAGSGAAARGSSS